MRVLKRLFPTLLTLAFLFSFQTTGFAQFASSFGGNTSTDYQPTTRNPQADVKTGLQPNNANLQPTNAQSGISQQALPSTANLQVLGTKLPPNPNTTTIAKEDGQKNGFNWYILLFFGVLVIGAYAFIRRNRSSSAVAPEIPQEETVPILLQELTQKTKKKKSRSKKKSKK